MINGGFSNTLVVPLGNGPVGSFDAEDYFRAHGNDRALIPAEAPEAQDPLWSSTVANLHFNGPPGESVFINTALANTGSSSGKFSPRAPLNPVILSTAQAKFGATSFNSAGGGPISASNGSFSWGTGDATVEGWTYLTTLATEIFFDQRQAEPTTMPLIFCNISGAITLYVAGAARITSANSVIPTGSFFHWAWCRASGVSRLFVSGTQAGSNYTDSNNYTATGLAYIHGGFDGTNTANGYCGAFRMTRAARYTANFTPPTAPFPDY